jgi:hypothetical protein
MTGNVSELCCGIRSRSVGHGFDETRQSILFLLRVKCIGNAIRIDNQTITRRQDAAGIRNPELFKHTQRRAGGRKLLNPANGPSQQWWILTCIRRQSQ